MAIMYIIIFSYFKRRKKHYAKTILSRQWNVEKAFLNIYHKSALYSSIYFEMINSFFILSITIYELHFYVFEPILYLKSFITIYEFK